MSSYLYSQLTQDITELAESISRERQVSSSEAALSSITTPISPSELTDRVSRVWDACQSDQRSSSGQKLEIVRSVMDIVGRDLVVTPVVNGVVSVLALDRLGCLAVILMLAPILQLSEPSDGASDDERYHFQTTMQDRLDIVLTLYEVVFTAFSGISIILGFCGYYSQWIENQSLEPGAIFIPLLEELVELISVETWRDLWSYVETRSKRFTKAGHLQRTTKLALTCVGYAGKQRQSSSSASNHQRLSTLSASHARRSCLSRSRAPIRELCHQCC